MSQEDGKQDFSNLPRGAIGIKGLPLNRNARLPSIRTPRDLTLGSQPKRTFTPNIPVRRERKSTEPKVPDQKSRGSRNGDKSSPVAERGRGRGRGAKNLIQTEGSIFGEGVAAPIESLKDKVRESVPKMGFSSSKSLTSIKKEKIEIDISKMNSSMDNLLRDNFIDDGDDERESLKPIIFPILEISKKEEASEKVEDEEVFQNANLAQEMGFDIQKIEKFIKKEKDDTHKTSAKIMKKKDLPQNEVSKIVAGDGNQLLLLQFPKCVSSQHPDYQQRPSSSDSSTCNNGEEKSSSTSLSSLPDGRIGKLQILKSGKARIVFGDIIFDLDSYNQLHSRYETVCVNTSANSGDLSVLGNVMHKLNFVPDIENLLM